jgi:lipid-binding SYLF domain-containing protein
MNKITPLHALVIVGLLFTMGFTPAAHAKSKAKINRQVNETLHKLTSQVPGAKKLLQSAKGVLVFPNVIKAGIGIGGEYGEGALRIHGKSVAYYSIAAASIGFQLGAQEKDIVLVFLQSDALHKFRTSEGWKVGVDGSVALINVGTGGSVDTMKINEPIVGFVLGQKGLMYNFTLEGSKITKLDK